MDSPGLDVGDGALDHLADPVDALILLLGRLAQFAIGGLLMGRDHPSSHVSLVADPPGGVHSLQQSGRRLGRPHRAWTPDRGPRGPHEPSVGPDQDPGRSCPRVCA